MSHIQNIFRTVLCIPFLGGLSFADTGSEEALKPGTFNYPCRVMNDQGRAGKACSDEQIEREIQRVISEYNRAVSESGEEGSLETGGNTLAKRAVREYSLDWRYPCIDRVGTEKARNFSSVCSSIKIDREIQLLLSAYHQTVFEAKDKSIFRRDQAKAPYDYYVSDFQRDLSVYEASGWWRFNSDVMMMTAKMQKDKQAGLKKEKYDLSGYYNRDENLIMVYGLPFQVSGDGGQRRELRRYSRKFIERRMNVDPDQALANTSVPVISCSNDPALMMAGLGDSYLQDSANTHIEQLKAFFSEDGFVGRLIYKRRNSTGQLQRLMNSVLYVFHERAGCNSIAQYGNKVKLPFVFFANEQELDFMRSLHAGQYDIDELSVLMNALAAVYSDSRTVYDWSVKAINGLPSARDQIDPGTLILVAMLVDVIDETLAVIGTPVFYGLIARYLSQIFMVDEEVVLNFVRYTQVRNYYLYKPVFDPEKGCFDDRHCQNLPFEVVNMDESGGFGYRGFDVAARRSAFRFLETSLRNTLGGWFRYYHKGYIVHALESRL